MKKITSIVLCLVLLLNLNHVVYATSEDGFDYDTAFTITDFYNIPVVNCDGDEGLVYKFTAPATATYTIISISEYDIFGQLEDSDWNPIVWYGSGSDEDGDFELVADLTKGKTYYLWTDPDGVDVASYTMQISYEMKSGYYTYDAYTNDCVITAYSGSASSVTIPSTLDGKNIIGLDGCVFYENTYLKTVSFPNTIRTLGSDCFYGCTALTTVTLNEGLMSLASGAFEKCASLKTITIPSTVTDIGSSAFEGCALLDEVVFSEGLEFIKSSAFRDCTSLSEITLPKSLYQLSPSVFRGCTSLNKVVIQEGLQYVKNNTFRDCTSLKEIVFPESLIEIGAYVFRGCTALADVTFLNPDTVFDSDDDIFYKCSGFKIHSYSGSTAQTYAETYSMAFEAFVEPAPELNDPGFESAEELHVSGEVIDLSLNGSSKYYTFFLQGDKDFSMKIIAGSLSAMKVELYDANHLLVEEMTAPAGKSFCYACSPLSWGTYYIKVSPSGSTTGTGQLRVISDAIEPIMYDPGFTSASHITESEKIYSFDGLYEYIYYSFDMTTNNNVSIDITNHSNGHIEYELYQGKDDVIFKYDMSIGGSLEYSPELQQGRYYIRIYTPWNHAFSGELSITSNSLGTDDSTDTENQLELKVYEPVYEYVRQFKGGYVSVYNNGVYSLVDSQNNKHYSSNQDGFGDYSENIIATYDSQKGEITFINLDGYAFTLVGYKWAGEFLGGKCVVVDSEGMYGLIDTEGNFIIDCLYDEIIYDTSNMVLLCSDSSWTSVTLGQSTYSLKSRSSVPELYNPVLSVTGEHIIASNGTAYGILTSDNIQITDFQYDLIRDAQNGLFIGYYGDWVDLIELDGTVTATLTAYFVGGYSENKVAVFNDTKLFYVDKNGITIVNVDIDDIISAEEFHESYAVINVEGKGYTYIDTSGNIAVDSYWDYAARFAKGYALVMNYFNDNNGNSLRKWSIIDAEFNIVMTLEDDLYIYSTDDHSTDFSNDYIRTINRDTALMGFIRLENDSSEDSTGSTVQIHGQITSYNPNNATTIQLMQDGEVKYTTTILPEEESGKITQQFTMSEIEEGIYDMVIIKEGHLTYTITGIYVSSEDIDLTQSEKEYSNIALIAGDVNGDGSVTEGDVMMIRYSTNMNRTVSEAANPVADLNGDGSITEGDVLIIRYKQHINKGAQNCTFKY